MSTETDEIVLRVDGMHCQSCASTVTSALKEQGMQDINVSYTACEATFSNTTHKDIESIIKSITKLGYSASLPQTEGPEKVSYGLEIRVAITSILTLPLFLHMFLPFEFLHNPLVQLALCSPVFIIGLLYFGKSAWGSLMVKTPNMDVLITIGFCASFLYSLIAMRHYPDMPHATFFETCATIISLVFIGNLIEKRSTRQTTSALTDLLKIQKMKARKVVNEELIETDYRDLVKGDILQLVKGESVPVDGIITEGSADINESMVTGESIPTHKKAGDSVTGGTIVVNGHFRMSAEKVGKDTVVAHIIDMVKKAQGSAPKIQKLGDKVSAVFVPVVVGISIVTFFISHYALKQPFEDSILHSIGVLVVACPCAMGLATPTAVAVALGRAAHKGILIKGADTMEALPEIKNIALDKTGTLTTGLFSIKEISILNNASRVEVESILYSMEQFSTHPIAKSISKSLAGRAKDVKLVNVLEEEGIGMSASDNEGHTYKLGSYKIAETLTNEATHSAYLLKDSQLIATIDLQDELRKNAFVAINELQKSGIRIVMISGDKKEKCNEMAQLLGIEKVYAEQLPYEKLDRISELSKRSPTAMVGDGINDAPALAMANVGISLGAATKIAMQSAQVLLLGDNDLAQLPKVFSLSKQTLRIIKQNLFWAIIYNIVAIPLAASGILSPMLGAFSMAFSDVIVIGNSLRLKRMI